MSGCFSGAKIMGGRKRVVGRFRRGGGFAERARKWERGHSFHKKTAEKTRLLFSRIIIESVKALKKAAVLRFLP